MSHDLGVTNVAFQHTHQHGPTGDPNPVVEWCGQQDDEQAGEEERCAAHKLKEVEWRAGLTVQDHLLQDEGH